MPASNTQACTPDDWLEYGPDGDRWTPSLQMVGVDRRGPATERYLSPPAVLAALPMAAGYVAPK